MESKLNNTAPSVYSHMRNMTAVVDEANIKVREAMEGTRSSYVTRWGKLNDAIDSIQEAEILVIGGRPGSNRSL